MTTPSKSPSNTHYELQSDTASVCCNSISDILEWFIIVVIVFLAAISEMPFIEPYHGYIPTQHASPSSVSNLLFVAITFGPMYFVFMFNVFTLKITTYWQYEDEMSILREIEIAKNRRNKPNKLKILNNLYNNKDSNVEILSHLVSLTKSVLFTLSTSQLVSFSLKIFIASSTQNEHISNSFPSKFAAVSMSTNCLLFFCMMHSFRSIQTMSAHHKYNDTTFDFSFINSHCFNGNAYFGSNIWYLLRHIKLLSIFIIATPLLCSAYIGFMQVIDDTHYVNDIMGGFAVAIFCAYLSYNTFRDELLFEMVLPTLSMLMEIESEENNSRNVSPFGSVSAETKTFVVGKRKFPDIALGVVGTDTQYAYADTFGSTRNEYNIEDLEEIALHLGSSDYISTKMSRSIETDDAGVDVVDDDDDEEDDEIEIELVQSDDSTTGSASFEAYGVSVDDEDDNGSDTISQMSLIGSDDSSRRTKNNVLYNHRKNIKFRLVPPAPISAVSTCSRNSKMSQLSPLSLDYDRDQRNIMAPELYFSSIPSHGTAANTLSPLSASPRDYHNYME